MQQLADAMQRAEADMLKLLMSAWTRTPTPDVTSSGTTALWLQQQLHWYVAAAGVLGLIVAAGRMVWHHRVDPAVKAGAGVLRLVLVSGAGTAVVAAGVTAGDGFSNWVLTSSTKGGALAKLTAGGVFAQGAFTSSGLVIVLGIVAILAFIVQLALLIIRSALLVLLAGVWPLSAAASITEAGEAWYRKVTGWLFAFVLFKPAAAIVYAAAVRQFATGTDALGVVTGIVLVAMATLTLPALMRFVVPMVSSVGNVSGAAVAAGATTVATGAVMLGTGAAGASTAGAALNGSGGAAGAAANGSGGAGLGGVGRGSGPPSGPNGAGQPGGSPSGGGGAPGRGSSGAGSAPSRQSGPVAPADVSAGSVPGSPGGNAAVGAGAGSPGPGPSHMGAPGAVAQGVDRQAEEMTGGGDN